jgi:integrase
MKDLEKNHLRNFIKYLQENKLSSSMIYRAVATFKSVIRKAEIDDVIPYKGITTIETPKKNKSKAKFWDQSQVHYFLNATTDNKLHDLWKFALFTGLRAGELAGLKFDCIHFDKFIGPYQGAIEVKRIYNQKTRRIEETTKNGDSRIVPILPQAKDVLMRQKRAGEFVFGGNDNLESSHFNRQLQSALKHLPQLPRIPFHGLRHSFCSYLDSSGMNRRMVSEIMGHRDLNTTNLYSHVNNQMLGLEMERWLQNQNQQKTNNLQAISL